MREAVHKQSLLPLLLHNHYLVAGASYAFLQASASTKKIINTDFTGVLNLLLVVKKTSVHKPRVAVDDLCPQKKWLLRAEPRTFLEPGLL